MKMHTATFFHMILLQRVRTGLDLLEDTSLMSEFFNERRHRPAKP